MQCRTRPSGCASSLPPASTATWIGWRETPTAAAIRAHCGEDTRAIVMLGVNYGPRDDPLAILQERPRGAISVYAQGDDYHDVIKPRLKALGRWLIENAGGDIKVFVDTAPVMEKPLAQAAGLGWQGKHTNLVSRAHGSWLFLGAIFTTLDLPPDTPEHDHCGTCQRCLDVCPTAAFPGAVPARCAALHFLSDHRAQRPDPAGAAAVDRQPHLWLRRLPGRLPVEQIRASRARSEACGAGGAARAAPCRTGPARRCRLSARCSRKAPVKRIGRARFLRNVLIAIGNSGSAALASEAERLLDDPSPLVRGAAIWALGRLDRCQSSKRHSGGAAHCGETDPRCCSREWRRRAAQE